MEQEVQQVVDCLAKGGIVLIPTDTVYGLAVRPDIAVSVERLYQFKDRPRHLNLPIMIESAQELESLGLAVTSYAQRLLKSPFVPGALTLALGFKHKPLVPWLADREEVAIRIPNDERLLAILEKAGPLFVTSANKHKLPTPIDVDEALAQLNGNPDLVIRKGAVKTIPSTLVNCRLNPPVIERHGVISKEEISRLLGINL